MRRLLAVAAVVGLLATGSFALPAVASEQLPGSSHPGLGYLGGGQSGNLHRSRPSVTSRPFDYRPPTIIDRRPAVIGRTPRGAVDRSPSRLVMPPRQVPRSYGITGPHCRDTIGSGGRTGKACLQPDGSWSGIGD